VVVDDGVLGLDVARILAPHQQVAVRLPELHALCSMTVCALMGVDIGGKWRA
jgi:quinolinate synthase